jgi:hypothetical protein
MQPLHIVPTLNEALSQMIQQLRVAGGGRKIQAISRINDSQAEVSLQSRPAVSATWGGISRAALAVRLALIPVKAKLSQASPEEPDLMGQSAGIQSQFQHIDAESIGR